MKGRIVRSERAGEGASPIAHVSDEELQEGIDRLRRGESSGLAAKARVPQALVRAYAALSDEELSARADAAVVRLGRGGARRSANVRIGRSR